MAEQGEVTATREEVEGFVAKLREFHNSLAKSERAMLHFVLDSAPVDETGGYRMERRSGEDQPDYWQDLVAWIEEQAEEDTQGFAPRCFMRGC